MASANYKAFMSKIVASVGNTIKENKVEDAMAIQSLQAMANGICMCIMEILKEDKDHSFENALILEHKSPERLLSYCVKKAQEGAIKKPSGYGYVNVPVMVTSDMMCSWIKEYFALDDKAEIEEEERKAEEVRKAAEEKKAKKAAAEAKKKERQAKDLKKAEVLLEKEFSFNYKLTEKDQEFFKKLQKEGLVALKDGKWFIRDLDETEAEAEAETEDEDEEEDLDFIDEE